MISVRAKEYNDAKKDNSDIDKYLFKGVWLEITLINPAMKTKIKPKIAALLPKFIKGTNTNNESVIIMIKENGLNK